MHVTASAPVVVVPDELDPAFVEKEREIYQAQADAEAEADAAAGQEAEAAGDSAKDGGWPFAQDARGSLALVEQQFVKDPQQNVGKLLADAGVRAAYDSFGWKSVTSSVRR